MRLWRHANIIIWVHRNPVERKGRKGRNVLGLLTSASLLTTIESVDGKRKHGGRNWIKQEMDSAAIGSGVYLPRSHSAMPAHLVMHLNRQIGSPRPRYANIGKPSTGWWGDRRTMQL